MYICFIVADSPKKSHKPTSMCVIDISTAWHIQAVLISCPTEVPADFKRIGYLGIPSQILREIYDNWRVSSIKIHVNRRK